MQKIITCINCPVGCRMNVTISDNGEVLTVENNTCIRGERYARQECTLPLRMVTAVIPMAGSTVPLPVKTASPVPKHLIANVMNALSHVNVSTPVSIGDPVIRNVCDTGVDVIATRNIR